VLLKLNAQIEAEAVAKEGKDYRVYHQVGYYKFGSIESQLTDAGGGCVGGTGITDYVARVAAKAVPPQLPSK
jgi:hypothetical protein